MRQSTFKVTSAQLDSVFGLKPKIRNGKHTKSCQCYHCVKVKLAEMEERFTLALRGGAKITNPAQTVPVRAHFRKQQNHLKNEAWLRQIVEETVRRIMQEQANQQTKRG